MPFSTFLANQTLDNDLAAGNYMALFTTNPNADASGTEATGGSYARQAITFAAASGGVAASSNQVTFTVNSATYTHYAIFDAVTAGNMLDYGRLNNGTDIVVSVDDTDVIFPIGDVTCQIDTTI